MNTAAQKILVIGGGFSGMAAAIEGAKRPARRPKNRHTPSDNRSSHKSG